MKILLTGATGFIGSEFIRLLNTKYDIFALVRESSDTTQIEKMNCTIVRYTSYSGIHDIFVENSFGGVVHFASTVIVQHSSVDIENILDSNITFGTYLLEACKVSNVEWFINTGTFWQNYNSHDYNPVNLYAASKEAFEKIANYYTQTSQLIFTTIKLNDTFGSNDTRSKIFNLWYQNFLDGKLLEMSKGEQIIDICYIEDVISAYQKLIYHLSSSKKLDFSDRVFVVSSKERVTLKDLSKIFEEAVGGRLNIGWGFLDYREREVMIPYVSGDTVPGWNEEYTLNESIKRVIKEMKND